MSFLDACNCDKGSDSLGQPKCLELAKRASRLIVMSVFDSSGNYNEIKVSDFTDGSLPASFFTTKFNEDDPDDRWFMTERLKSPEPNRAEPFTETVDEIPYPIRQGLLNWSGMFYGSKAPPKYTKKLNSHGCGNKAVMWVDVAGNLVGKMVRNSSGDLVLRPVVIEPGTWYAQYNYSQVSARNKIMLNFIFSEVENDSNSNFILASNIGADLNSEVGILDVNLELSSITTTGATLTATYDYGAFDDDGLMPHVGLEVADIVATNTTDDAAITGLTVSEDPDGTYALTWDAQDAGDAISIGIDEDGFVATAATGNIPT